MSCNAAIIMVIIVRIIISIADAVSNYITNIALLIVLILNIIRIYIRSNILKILNNITIAINNMSINITTRTIAPINHAYIICACHALTHGYGQGQGHGHARVHGNVHEHIGYVYYLNAKVPTTLLQNVLQHKCMYWIFIAVTLLKRHTYISIYV